jgi:hypothetical protein
MPDGMVLAANEDFFSFFSAAFVRWLLSLPLLLSNPPFSGAFVRWPSPTPYPSLSPALFPFLCPTFLSLSVSLSPRRAHNTHQRGRPVPTPAAPCAHLLATRKGLADGQGASARNCPSGLAREHTGGRRGQQRGAAGDDGGGSENGGGRWAGRAGYADGKGAAARFNNYTDVVVDKEGTIVVADRNKNRLRKIVGRQVTTLVGGSEAGMADGVGAGARFKEPRWCWRWTSAGVCSWGSATGRRILFHGAGPEGACAWERASAPPPIGASKFEACLACPFPSCRVDYHHPSP